MPDTVSSKNSRRVVIIGAGFGGLSAAVALKAPEFQVTLIDQHNYHLFQPLLYQVATAALSPADIAGPVRSIVRDHRNVSVILAQVSGIDLARNEVLAEGRRIPFDDLIIATGARHAYFGHDDWAAHAPGLKTIDDATYLRRRILLAFEKAETEPDPAERRRLLNFVIVGGGATGVEMAGAIAELAKRALAADFRVIDPRSARVILVAGRACCLGLIHRSRGRGNRLARRRSAARQRNRDGCNRRLDRLGAHRYRYSIWAAGVMASPAGRWLETETDRAGRVMVNSDLTLPGHPNVFIIGDTAHVDGRDGNLLPGVAPVAKQEGKYVAKLLRARLAGKTLPPFRYRDYGSLATIGRKSAVRTSSSRASGVGALGVAHLFPDRISQPASRSPCTSCGTT
jgi:NADH dehydrogenase